MQVTPQKSTVISYLPQEIRETRLTEVTYLPIKGNVRTTIFKFIQEG